jgi:two-component system response regulator PilR (NtrC family)
MPAPAPRPSSRKRILVIDDELDILEVMDGLLTSAGYEVATAESGAAAIERAKQAVFDLAITDLRMPGLSGVDTIAALKGLNPRLPVIVVSGYISDESARSCRQQGAARIVAKPISIDELLHAVGSTLGEACG